MPEWTKQMKKVLGEYPAPYDEFIWLLNNTRSGTTDSKARTAVQHFIDKITTRLEDLHEERQRNKDPIIEDGFGSSWSKRCPICGKLTMAVMRPGDVQCQNPNCPQWKEQE